eukprot:TRINITY_DN407_c0_g1_i1.p1 TRINITY_DN407_c0_g1~~TRINITY_DN407_c0_g1_i1.p1  ORF type:complete len:234 (-),score=22.81 TRINITY_DN407_c0_g1_i1:504-1205(-)
MSTVIVFLLTVITIVTAQFTCNNLKIKEQCDGFVTVEGKCQWFGIYCSVVPDSAPAPATTAQPVAPPLTCAATAGEASCIYDPCLTGEICFANTEAVCVINNCIGMVTYLGTTLSEPCSAVYVDIVTQTVVQCNVREITRLPSVAEPTEESPEAAPSTLAAVPSDTPTISGALTGVASNSMPVSPQIPTMSFGLPTVTPSTDIVPADGVGLADVVDDGESDDDEMSPSQESAD